MPHVPTCTPLHLEWIVLARIPPHLWELALMSMDPGQHTVAILFACHSLLAAWAWG